LRVDLRERIRVHLAAWCAREVERRLQPLFAARRAELAGAARGLIYQLTEALGTLPRHAVEPQLAALTAADRKQLTVLGVRFGVESVFLKPLLKPAAMRFRALLYGVRHGLRPYPVLANPAAASLARDPQVPAGLYAAAGLRVLGDRVVRPDALERFALGLRELARQGPFVPTPALAQPLGCKVGAIGGVIAALGYKIKGGDEPTVSAKRRRRDPAPQRPARDGAESPFAKLKEHRLARS
jgi:ATP-dependent RNA helicase SUPV3L1/SUV3